MIRSIIHASLLIALATPAAATPPDVMQARATILCTGGDDLAFLIRTQGNHGSHFVTASHVAVVKLDAKAGTWMYVPHGTVVSNNLDELEGSGGVKTTYDVPDATLPITGSLQEWGLGPCWIRDRQHWHAAGQQRRFDYRFTIPEEGAKPVFTLGLGDERRAVPSTYADPRGEYYDADKRYPTGVVPFGERGLELYGDPEVERVEVLAEVHLETRSVLHLRVINEMGPTEINNAGLQRHRAKAYDETKTNSVPPSERTRPTGPPRSTWCAPRHGAAGSNPPSRCGAPVWWPASKTPRSSGVVTAARWVLGTFMRTWWAASTGDGLKDTALRDT